ncbi:MAG: dihydrodipicolinate synthase family protein [Spirochaetota bacterium]
MMSVHSESIAGGVWPTMITPMHRDGTVDFESLDRLVDWYLEAGVSGLFAVCQSSEMFDLTLDERVLVARRVVERTSGRSGVIVSGNIAGEHDAQYEELSRLADVGADAVVLVANRYADVGEGEEQWRARIETILDTLPHTLRLGLYECPYPYHRILHGSTLSWLASLGRFSFLKDTSCDPAIQRERSEILQRNELRAFNANAATLLSSLRLGYAGYSGVMANFHPELYVWLCRNYEHYPQQAERLQSFLGVASVFERQGYPMNAKYYLKSKGVLAGYATRARPSATIAPSQRIELEQLDDLGRRFNLDLPVLGST